MKVLYLTSSVSPSGRENVGDRVILAGARNLIAAAFGYHLYREQGRWSRFEGNPDDFDLIVYAGMPQYGARGEPSREEQYFQEIIDASTRPVFMNIGGGVIHPLGINAQYELLKMAGSKVAPYYRSQEKRIAYRSVRDVTAKLFFDRMGIQAELRCCPAYYSTQTIRPGAPRQGAIAALNNRTFVTNHFRGDIGELMAELQNRHPDYDIVSHSGSDLGLLSDIGRKHLYFRSEMALLSYYTTVRNLFALRVHAAIPAWTMGAKVVVGGFDNRVGMFDDVGMPVPWINMLAASQGSIIDQFETLMKDDRCHAPLEKRRELVDFQLRRAASEVRASAPRLVEMASETPVTEQGWMSHPPAGTVHPVNDGFRLTPVELDIPTGDEESGSEIVAVPEGVRAPAAYQPQLFPLEVPGRKFSARIGEVVGTRIVGALKGKSGDFARNYSAFLPRGNYNAKVRLIYKAGSKPGPQGQIDIAVRQNDLTVGSRSQDVAALATKDRKPGTVNVPFQSQFGAAPTEFVITVSGFTGTEELTFAGLELSRT